MTRSVRLALAINFLIVTVAHADRLAIYSDAAFTDSTLNDNAPRIVNLYVLHSGYQESAAVRFATHASPGFTGVWLGDSSQYLILGTSPVDVSVSYRGCIGAPAHVLTMSYQLFGTSSPCAELTIGAPNGSGLLHAIAISDVCFEPVACHPGPLHVNCVVATEPSTWGRVKALYRN